MPRFLSVLLGDYVLRDPAGAPRGMVRIMIKWKYPFQAPADTLLGKQRKEADMKGNAMENSEQEKRQKEEIEVSQRPVAKPRVSATVILSKIIVFLRSQMLNMFSVSAKIVFLLFISSCLLA